jgi:hypothetical protein
LSQTPALLEDLLAPKRSLGADYRFERDMLEVKANCFGISGVFTRRAVSAGTEIISVPIVNGSMTPFRAYEEASALLQSLGPNRFNVSQEFAIASAVYLRCIDEENAATDVLITESDLAASYAGSPMTSYDSLARAKLLSSNNREALEYAAEMDRQIAQLGVIPELFRALLGYISSRAWKGVGVIPVMDWFNASFADGANCTFQTRDGRFCYVTIKDVATGDELLWNYNNANAITTWFNYGYVDIERPTLAFLEIRVEESQRQALENFAIRQLNLASNKNSTDTNVDKCLFQRELLTPGNLANGAMARRSVANSMKTFVNARAWFRMLVLSSEANLTGRISLATINADGMPFGADIETRVIATMRAALKTGLEQLRARVSEFSNSEVGRSISMAPYVDMATEAHNAWDKALGLATKICLAASLETCLPEINSKLDVDVDSQAALSSALAEIEESRPSLLAAMVGAYASALG